MATAISIQTAKAPFFIPTANSLDFVWTAGDPTGMTFVCDGKELVLFNNTDVGSQTITIASQPDIKGRSGDITAYSLGTTEFGHWCGGLTTEQGWMNPTTKIITITPSHAGVKVAVLRLPI